MKNKRKIQLVNPNLIPINPRIGVFFKVNGIEKPENIFKEEFDAISKVHSSE